MGREVRYVPENWEHPKDNNGNYIPLFEGPYSKKIEEWIKEREMWMQGKIRKFSIDSDSYEWEDAEGRNLRMTFEEWNGDAPQSSDYMPEWTDKEKTHLMMYETCTEGTPISPAFKTPEELAKWLADNNASAFGRMTATYEQWLAMCNNGSTVSAVYSPETGLISGVAAEK